MNKFTVVREGVREQCVLVSDAISSTIKSLIGPGVKLKSFIDADGTGTITRSIIKILENLEVEEHPTGKAYKQTCDGYIIHVGETGLCTLVTLIGLLVKKGNELEKSGIPLINVLEGFKTAANICNEVLHSIAITFDTFNLHDLSPPDIKSTSSPKHIHTVNDKNEDVDWHLNNNNNGSDFNDETSHDINTMLENMHFPQFSNDSSNSTKKKTHPELAQLLAKFGATLPPLPELEINDDVGWFFEGDEDDLDSSHLDNLEHPAVEANIISPTKLESTGNNLPETNHDILEIIGKGLSHGKEDMMAIAIKVARYLGDEWNEKRVVVRHVSFDHESVIDGFLLPTNEDSPFLHCLCTSSSSNKPSSNLSIGNEINVRTWIGKVCVVDGNIGELEEMMSGEVNAELWYDLRQQMAADEESYNQDILSLLQAHQVKLVICSGDIHKSLDQLLHSNGIHHMHVAEWDSICRLTGRYPLGDIEDINDDYITPLLKIEHFVAGGKWKENRSRRFRNSNNEFKTEAYLRITRLEGREHHNNVFPVSVVVGAATKAVSEEKERQFWNCFHRLRNSVKRQMVLPGAGYSELKCILALEEVAKQMVLEGSGKTSDLPSGLHYTMLEAEAVTGFAMCLEEYLIILAQNVGVSFVMILITIKLTISRYGRKMQ